MEGKFSEFRIKGMQRDLSRSKFNPEYAFENKNLRITSRGDGTLFSLTNERGQTKINLQDKTPKYYNINIYGNVSENEPYVPDVKTINIYGNISEYIEETPDVFSINIYGNVYEYNADTDPNTVVFRGLVKDAVLQSPIEGATVNLKSSTGYDLFATTDEFGFYRIDWNITESDWVNLNSTVGISTNKDGYELVITPGRGSSYVIYDLPDYNTAITYDVPVDDLYLGEINQVQTIEIYGNILEATEDQDNFSITPTKIEYSSAGTWLVTVTAPDNNWTAFWQYDSPTFEVTSSRPYESNEVLIQRISNSQVSITFKSTGSYLPNFGILLVKHNGISLRCDLEYKQVQSLYINPNPPYAIF